MRNTIIFAGYFVASAVSHSWIEQMQLISSNGSYAGDIGYPRGYVSRTDPGFDGYSDKWQLPSPDYDLGRTRINTTDFLCHPAQRSANYTSQHPKLQASPDTYVALRYLENGHVTQPWIPAGKPDGSGSVFVYGTYSPSADEKVADVLQWNTAGDGGNGKGFLMTAQNFDDGRCYQPNQSPISIQRQMQFPDTNPGQESWCETDLHIPADSKSGSTLTIYWIWSWQTSTHTEGAPCGKDEYYTTCADIDIVDSSKNLFDQPVKHTIRQQDPRDVAPSDYKSRTAAMTTPNLVTTEGCSITDITSSSLPASLTQLTSLPGDFYQTFINNAHPIVTHSPAAASSVAVIPKPVDGSLPTIEQLAAAPSSTLLAIPVAGSLPTSTILAVPVAGSLPTSTILAVPVAGSLPTAAAGNGPANSSSNWGMVTVTVTAGPPQTTVLVTPSTSPSSATTLAPISMKSASWPEGMIGQKREVADKIIARRHGKDFKW